MTMIFHSTCGPTPSQGDFITVSLVERDHSGCAVQVDQSVENDTAVRLKLSDDPAKPAVVQTADERAKIPIRHARIRNQARPGTNSASSHSIDSAGVEGSASFIESARGSRASETDTGNCSKTETGSNANEGASSEAGLPGAGASSGTTSLPAEFNVSQVDLSPQLVQTEEPVYPFAARHKGICGRVVVKVLVGTDGRISKPSILESEPRGIFEQAVLEALQKWKFKPGIHHGRPVATWIVLPVRFKLSG
jgi:TonB family protein